MAKKKSKIKKITLSSAHQKMILLAGIFLCLALYSYKIGVPTEPYYDEVYHVPSARQYLALEKVITDTAHPPLGKLLMASSMAVLGDVSWAWRLPSLLFGIGLIVVIFLLAKTLTKHYWFSLGTAAFFAMDGMHLTQSRIAMLNTSMLLCMLLSLLALLPYLLEKKYSRPKAFLASGIFLGLALSIRWVSGCIFGVVGFLLFIRFFYEKDTWHYFLDCLFYFILVPLAVYFTTHLVIMWAQGLSVKDVLNYQVHMWNYHSNLTEAHGYGSAWWGWPILKRPIWYFFERKEELVYGILCIGNPAIYWMIPFAMAFVLLKWLEERKFLYGFILLGFLTQWLPWYFVSRVQFFHYFYTATPFAILAVMLLLHHLWRIPTVGKGIVYAYVGLVIVLFFYWYPLLTGLPISESFFQNHLWFKTWI